MPSKVQKKKKAKKSARIREKAHVALLSFAAGRRDAPQEYISEFLKSFRRIVNGHSQREIRQIHNDFFDMNAHAINSLTNGVYDYMDERILDRFGPLVRVDLVYGSKLLFDFSTIQSIRVNDPGTGRLANYYKGNRSVCDCLVPLWTRHALFDRLTERGSDDRRKHWYNIACNRAMAIRTAEHRPIFLDGNLTAFAIWESTGQTEMGKRIAEALGADPQYGKRLVAYCPVVHDQGQYLVVKTVLSPGMRGTAQYDGDSVLLTRTLLADPSSLICVCKKLHRVSPIVE